VKRVSLELGGKSAHIIFDDADIESAAKTAAAAVWNASGQMCAAGTRLMVQRGVYDEVVSRIVSASRGLQIGSPFDPSMDLGPVVSQEQLARVTNYVAIGQEEGARLALGGRRVGDTGFFFEPTVFVDVSNDMRIAQEEIFGPVMGILPFDTEEEVYAVANDSEYGLAAGVWTTDIARGHRASRALRAGIVWINTYLQSNAAVPYGGTKQSGHGRANGEESLHEFLQTKTTWVRVSE
jgi:acyl-CoA reductase-like NAD-dependent aldehyde dehydrogenase